MLIDALNATNYLSISIEVINKVGLINAVYFSELLSIYSKAKRKRKLYNNYFFVDRNYITERTTISDKSQRDCDLVFSSLKIIEVDEKNSDLLKINLDNYMKILMSDDILEIDSNLIDVSQELNRRNNIDNVLRYIETKFNEYSFCNNLKRWIDSISKDRNINESTVDLFINPILDYFKGSKDYHEVNEVINIAIGYLSIDYTQCLELYEKNLTFMKKSKKNTKVADVNNLSNKTF